MKASRPSALVLVSLSVVTLLSGCDASSGGAGGSSLTSGSGGAGGGTGSGGSIVTSGSGGTGGITGSGGFGGSSCDGNAGACTQPENCPISSTPCTERICSNGCCATANLPVGTLLPAGQTTGDCQVLVCDGNGGVKSIATYDPPANLDDCHTADCDHGMPIQAPKATGTPCSSGGGHVCGNTASSQAGMCIECLVDSNCTAPTSPLCDTSTGTCVGLACKNGIKDGTETDVDCGGVCSGCAEGKACAANADCMSALCASGLCAGPSCQDGVTNGAETDVDCGGGTCSPCVAGKLCTTGTDCSSGTCSAGACAVDLCAGVTCAPLDACHTAGVCASATGICTNPPKPNGTACDDGNTNTADDVCTAGTCAGVDHCLGVTCTALDACHAAGSCTDHATGACSNPTKADGTACDDGNTNTAGDVCTAGTCAGVDHCLGVTCTALDACHAAGSCTDHATGACSNPNKTDGTACDDGNTNTADDVCTAGTCAGVDHCLGVICTALDTCHVAGMCINHATGACSNPNKTDGTACDDGNTNTADDVCTAGTCAGVDHCLGVTCTALDTCHVAGTCINHATGACSNPNKIDGTACGAGGAGMCMGGACVMPSCTSGVQDGGESGIDCGGGVCPACSTGGGCAFSTDCQSLVCSGGTCAAPTCIDNVKNGNETDVDCGGNTCSLCGAGKLCVASSDCVDQVCSVGACAPPTCIDGVKNGSETDVDCGGGTCSLCAAGKLCTAGNDCTDLVCSGGACTAASCTDTVKNGTETGVDCGGSCSACPAVSSTTPADGTTSISFDSTITVTFNTTSMDIATLTSQTSSGACADSVQVSIDNFVTCIGMSNVTLAGSVLTLTPAPALSFGSTYKIKVTASAKDTKGNKIEAYTSATGLTTSAPMPLCVSGSVVISEVYGGGGNAGATYANDYVVLHNRGTTATNLSGWSVQYGSATGTNWSGLVSLSGVIAPGGYYLVKLASNNSGGAALPPGDATNTSINMGGTAGKVALVKNTTPLTGSCPNDSTIADLVGYGNNANCFMGASGPTSTVSNSAGRAPVPGNTTAVSRGGSGCTNGSNNATDFTDTSPSPKNASSTRVSCTCGDQTLNEGGAATEADWCVVQYPTSLSVLKSTSTGNIYSRIYEAGVTPLSGAPWGWSAQVGYGPDNVNPENQSGWQWFAATYNSGYADPSNDEFQGAFNAPAIPGQYRYGFRFSANGTDWTYCDANGAGADPGLLFEVTQLPILTVTP